MVSTAETQIAKLVAVTSENQELKSKLMESRNQCESLEQALRFHTAKATEFQEMLALQSKGDENALMTKIMDHSLALAEKTLENDRLKMKLQKSEKERTLRDQERDAHSEMMAELNRVIREQQIEIQLLQNPLTLKLEDVDYEYDKVDSEFDKLCNIHEHLKDAKYVEPKPETESSDLKERNAKVFKLKTDLKHLHGERVQLRKKVEAQSTAISILQDRSKTRESNNLALVKDLKAKYEKEKLELLENKQALEAEIEELRKKRKLEPSESFDRSILHGELIDMESVKQEPLLFLSDTKADYEVFEDDSSEITASTINLYDSDNSSPASSPRHMYVSLDAYMNPTITGIKIESIGFSTERCEI